LGTPVTERRVQRPDQIFRWPARVYKNLLKKRDGTRKKDARSYRLHGEEKELARCIVESVRWRPEALLVSKTIPVTLVEDALNRRAM
jgi:hypothetical protein